MTTHKSVVRRGIEQCFKGTAAWTFWSPLLALSLGLGNTGAGVAQVKSPTATSLTAALITLRQGSQIQLNGRTYPVAWAQWQDSENSEKTYTGISDGGLAQGIGLELLSTANSDQQPIRWFSNRPASLTAHLSSNGQYRYLDISDLAQQANWQVQAQGNTLQISFPPARIQAIRQGRQPWGDRIVVELDRSTPWQAARLASGGDALKSRELVVTLNANLNPGLAQSFQTKPGDRIQSLKLEVGQGRTVIRVGIPSNLRSQVSTLGDPNRLIIDVRSDVATQRDILWASGLRWQEQVINVGPARYPVVWLTVNPRQSGLKLKPIWSDPKTLVGTASLATLAQRWQAAAAINGGYFNRKNRLPLGAIRQAGTWMSSPILNRGAIAWNETGEFKLGRLGLQETLTTSTGQRLPVGLLNSGYAQNGIARYTSDWGSTYTPLTNNETIVAIQNNQVFKQQPGGPAGQTAVPIPANGYLLTIRGGSAASFPIGTVLQSAVTTTPSDFNQYPHILGAGPVLLQNRQIVLDAKAEQFRSPFDRQFASRSGIGTTSDGKLVIAAVHNRINGPGPTLQEMAQLMQQLGAIDALNLDGGSSTALYLGGQLLDRDPSTAARVHNGIGIFVQPQ